VPGPREPHQPRFHPRSLVLPPPLSTVCRTVRRVRGLLLHT
jgi:hypothetical protein